MRKSFGIVPATLALLFLLLSFHSSSSIAAPNFAECALTPQGQMACTTYRGATCTLGGTLMYCSGGGGSARCYRSARGLSPVCEPYPSGYEQSTGCYVEGSVSKCYPKSIYLSSNGPSLDFGGQTVNVASGTRNVVFSSLSTSGPFTINGVVAAGDFLR